MIDVFESTYKYKIPSNEELIPIFKKITGSDTIVILSRNIIDKSIYSCLEKIELNNSTFFVLKSVSEMTKNEVMVHQYVNNLRINAPYFYYGKIKKTTDENGTSFIIMEYLEYYYHLYNILEEELYFEAVRSLGEMHLFTMQKITVLREKLNIPVYDYKWYINNVERIIFELSRFSIRNPHPEYLPKELMSKLQRLSPKIKHYLESLSDIPLTLVHGDFDSGNIIYFEKGIHAGNVKAIDWGHGHIGIPLIDIAHLVNSLGYFDYDMKITLIAEYLKTCSRLLLKRQ